MLQHTSRRHSHEVQIAHAHYDYRLWLDIHVGNVLHVIFRYVIDTQAGAVLVERLLLHKGDSNNILPIAYRSVPQYGYCVSCTVRFTGVSFQP